MQTSKAPGVSRRQGFRRRSLGLLAVALLLVTVGAAAVVFSRPWNSKEPLTAAAGQTPAAATTPPPVGRPGKSACVKAPSSCGYPDETNTGVPAEQVLSKVPDEISSGPGWKFDDRGWVVVDEPNALLENLELTTPLDIQSTGATIRNVRITVFGETWAIALRHARDTAIEHVTISAPPGFPRLMVGIKDIFGDSEGTKVQWSDISGVSTGIQTVEGLIEGNYIHDLGFQAGDHLNGTTSNGSTRPLAIVNNTILNSYGQTDAISFFQDFGIEGNRTVRGNLLAGGGYTVYAGQNPGSPPTFNIRITDNRISRKFFPKGGYYGPATAFDAKGVGNVWSNNIWDETGADIPVP